MLTKAYASNVKSALFPFLGVTSKLHEHTGRWTENWLNDFQNSTEATDEWLKDWLETSRQWCVPHGAILIYCLTPLLVRGRIYPQQFARCGWNTRGTRGCHPEGL